MFLKKKTNIKASNIAKFLGLKINFKDFKIQGVTPITDIKNFHISSIQFLKAPFFIDKIVKLICEK